MLKHIDENITKNEKLIKLLSTKIIRKYKYESHSDEDSADQFSRYYAGYCNVFKWEGYESN